MKIQLLVLLAIVGVCAADNCCSMEDRREVLNQWAKLWSSEFTDRRIRIGQETFKKLFEKAPETKALFKNVNVDNMESAQFRAHMIRVTNGVDTVINLTFNPDALEQHLQHLGTQHAGYAGVKAEHFKIFREGFLEILPQAVPCFNSAAWASCLKATQDRIAQSL